MVNSAAPMVRFDLVTFQLIANSLSLSLSWRAYYIFFLGMKIYFQSQVKELLGLVWNYVKTTLKKEAFQLLEVLCPIISVPVEGTFIMAGLKLNCALTCGPVGTSISQIEKNVKT